MLFLNRDLNGRQVEYLSYTTGRTERDRATAPALAALLSRITGREVSEAQLEALAEQSRAETPSVESLFGPTEPVSRVLGGYEILAEIGRGGMGVVYLARQLSLGRLVALKMLPADLAGDEVALSRFRRELRLLARCEHPNIVMILDSGTMPDGQLYYAMEYIPGCNLDQVWRELSGSDHPGDASTLSGSSWNQAVHLGQPQDARAGDRAARPARPMPDRRNRPSRRSPAAVARLALGPRRPRRLHAPGRHARPRRRPGLAGDPRPGDRPPRREAGQPDADARRLAGGPDGLRPGQGAEPGPDRPAAPAACSARCVTPLPSSSPPRRLKVGPTADVRGPGGDALGASDPPPPVRRIRGRARAERADLTTRMCPGFGRSTPRFDRDLEAIVARATERRASDRIATAGQLAEYLQLLSGWEAAADPAANDGGDGRPLGARTQAAGRLGVGGGAGDRAHGRIAFVLITRSRNEKRRSGGDGRQKAKEQGHRAGGAIVRVLKIVDRERRNA